MHLIPTYLQITLLQILGHILGNFSLLNSCGHEQAYSIYAKTGVAGQQWKTAEASDSSDLLIFVRS